MNPVVELVLKRELCRRSLYDFCLMTTPNFKQHKWQETLCTVLESLTLTSPSDNPVVNQGNSSGKTY